jgi:hypothetical protein
MREPRGIPSRVVAVTGVAVLAGLGGAGLAGGGTPRPDGPTAAKAEPVKLELRNGWKRWDPSAAAPALLKDGRVIHLKGAMERSGGASPYAFKLPPAYRPSHEVRVLAQFQNLEVGELLIAPNGRTSVVPNNANAAALTSLDGISFVL